MLIIDAHCDTITSLMKRKNDESLYKNSCQVDIDRMKRTGGFIQFFAAFIHPDYCQAYAMRRAIQIIDRFHKEINLYNDDIMLCCNYRDIMLCVSENKAGAILSIEGGDALQGELAALRMFYKLGVRSICLTWNYRNEIADGVKDGITNGGLTPFGRKVIDEMNELGMIIDVSHISEKGFWDVIELSKEPVIASHSNAKSICSHRRNLSDEQIGALKDKDCVIGINLEAEFLNDSGKAACKDVIRHIEHIAGLTGSDHIGLGEDFDGLDNLPADIRGIQNTELIFDELLKLNYSDDFIKKFAGLNFLRIIKKVLK